MNITDIFGTAELNEKETAFEGEIGLKYGLRMVMKMPNSLINPTDTPSTTDLETSRKEKAYYCEIENLSEEELLDLNFSFPICSAEIELKDQMIKDLNISSGQDSYDLDCLARKLVQSTEFQLLFRKVMPLDAVSSMCLAYSNIFFLRSIGIADNWDEDARMPDFERETEFKETNLLCRKFFASFYNSAKFTHEENLKFPKLEFPDFWKLLFGGFEWPKWSLDINIELCKEDFPHKIVTRNPFDKNLEECEDDVDKLI